VGQVETQPRQRHRIATRLTSAQAEPAVTVVPALIPLLPVVTEEPAATLPPRAQSIALALVPLARVPQAAQAAQPAWPQASSLVLVVTEESAATLPRPLLEHPRLDDGERVLHLGACGPIQ